MWGSPETITDLRTIFGDYFTNKVAATPWFTRASSTDSSYDHELAHLCEKGLLVINSQCSVNGLPSNDPVFGWGPGNGRVYQKVRTSD